MTAFNSSVFHNWDYLIVTASNSTQASSYQQQLELRREIGFLSGFKHVLVVSDPEGKRIGSGGSTIISLIEVLNREIRSRESDKTDPLIWQKILEDLRILIIHAGGDSRRLPPYGPCGKIFIPVPGQSDSFLPMTLFDRLIPIYKALPTGQKNNGQVVVATGDVLLDFNPAEVNYNHKGIIGLGYYAEPDEAKNHGVFCSSQNGQVRLFLQKPSIQMQKAEGSLNRFGQSILDIGIMNMDAESAVKLIGIGGLHKDKKGRIDWEDPYKSIILEKGLDFYQDICCAMGNESSLEHLKRYASNLNSKAGLALLTRIFEHMSSVPFFVEVLPQCHFLHFGTLNQLIDSGNELMLREDGICTSPRYLSINNDFSEKGSIRGANAWLEGCRIQNQISLGGNNIVTGVDITKKLSMPPRMCLDVLSGKNRMNQTGWFVRCYGIYDQFNLPLDADPRFCDQPLNSWLQRMDCHKVDIISQSPEPNCSTLWHARLFPFVSKHDDYRNWLWLLEKNQWPQENIKQWKEQDRYSLAEIAILSSQDDFHFRRFQNRSREIKLKITKLFQSKSSFSAKELGLVLENLNAGECLDLITTLIKETFKTFNTDVTFENRYGIDDFELPRILHSIGTALEYMIQKKGKKWWTGFSSELIKNLDAEEKNWLENLGIPIKNIPLSSTWPDDAKKSAFNDLSRIILLSDSKKQDHPSSILRSDEIVWGRAPARLDLGGGWTDTPPYSLEHGGCVINAAVNLNGQPPIHSYARIIKEPVIRINSIDHSSRILIKNLDELLDYREPTSQFGLAKAALVLSGFSHPTSRWPQRIKTLEQMLVLFGGGIELTTLAAIPSGSGLGTSSIMGSVLLAVINRLKGKTLSQRELFHLVLQLEQELTTGGGWQDQIGGVVDGVKIITTEPGMIPDPQIRYVPSDLLDPNQNQGHSLLYYTGIRRLAKNILQYVVGNYLDRNRYAMTVLEQIHAHPPLIAETLSSKNLEKFGEMIDIAWTLNKNIDPDSSTEEIEDILTRIRPYIYGAKLLGAGGGGFLFIICRSTEEGELIRHTLEKNPPNDKARFFDYGISNEGLVVTVC
jgi:fucokinase